VPKHGCAAGFAPRNLLFPAWLPGTAENCTPAGNHSSNFIDLVSRRRVRGMGGLSEVESLEYKRREKLTVCNVGPCQTARTLYQHPLHSRCIH
jgi:hypothetical protein